MDTFIGHIETANPPVSYKQETIRDQMKHFIADDRRTQAIIHKIYKESGIEKRHSVIEDYTDNPSDYVLFHPNKGILNPSTGLRNAIYVEHARKIFVDIAQRLLNNSQYKAEEITHVITISCTGFFAPGPDFEIIESLGLSPNTQRFHLGFMGCYAAFPALKMANSFCQSQPDARVLVISVELCTLHFQASKNIDHLIGAAVFADGAAGCIVTNQKSTNAPSLSINTFANSITDGGKKDMAWTIGDHGFEMVLSTYVPDIIEANLDRVMTPLFEKADITIEDVDYWGLHPGGRAIIDKVQNSLKLSKIQVEASRQVLANYGNMSSATIFFVLKRILENPDITSGSTILGLAFGPGLTIESGIFRKNG